MNKDYEYKVLSSTFPENLTTFVNDHLSVGWELYGFPFGSGGGSTAFFCQAIIRRHPDGRQHDQ